MTKKKKYLTFLLFAILAAFPIYLLCSWPISELSEQLNRDNIFEQAFLFASYLLIALMIGFALLLFILLNGKSSDQPSLIQRIYAYFISKRPKTFKSSLIASGILYGLMTAGFVFVTSWHIKESKKAEQWVLDYITQNESTCYPEHLRDGYALVNLEFQGYVALNNGNRALQKRPDFFAVSSAIRNAFHDDPSYMNRVYNQEKYHEIISETSQRLSETMDARGSGYEFGSRSTDFDTAYFELSGDDAFYTNTLQNCIKKYNAEPSRELATSIAQYYDKIREKSDTIKAVESDIGDYPLLRKFFSSAVTVSNMNGEASAETDRQLIKWLMEASKFGDIQAQYYLGLIYLNGMRTIKNDNLALKHFLDAAIQGNMMAQYESGLLLTKESKHRDKGVKLLMVSANQGNCLASSALAKMYFDDGFMKPNSPSAQKAYLWSLITDYLQKNNEQRYVPFEYDANHFFPVFRKYRDLTCKHNHTEPYDLKPETARDLQNLALKWQQQFEKNKDDYAAYETVSYQDKLPPPASSLSWIPIKAQLCTSGSKNTQMTSSELFKKVAPSIWKVQVFESEKAVTVNRPFSQGTAVAVSENVLITNCHVVQESEFLTITNNGVTHRAKIISGDPKADKCVIQTRDGKLLDFIAAAKSGQGLEIGEKAFTIGTPKGLDITFADGIVSGVRVEGGFNYVQTTAPISPGSSGGALLDSSGNLLGITTFYVKDGQNLNFAISIADFCK